MMGEVLGARVVAPDEVDPAELSSYDIVGFGSGIFNMSFHPDLLKFVDRLPDGAECPSIRVLHQRISRASRPSIHTQPLRQARVERLRRHRRVLLQEFRHLVAVQAVRRHPQGPSERRRPRRGPGLRPPPLTGTLMPACGTGIPISHWEWRFGGTTGV